MAEITEEQTALQYALTIVMEFEEKAYVKY
jgi:hypothetical protein